MNGERALLVRRLRAALGRDAVELAAASDALRLQPEGREGLRLAARILFEHATPWQAAGLGPAPARRVTLSTRGFRGIIDYWPQDLVARIGAGSSLEEAQELLRGEGLRLPATALHPRERSLGALFATAQRGWRSGPNRGLRESVLGLTAVDGGGRVLKGGGRVMKNVAGYDLVRLHHGARGAFGLITDLIVKLEALPEAEAAFAVPAPVESLPDLLSSLRLPAASMDPCVQLWLDEEAGRRAGVFAEGSLLVQAEGWKPAVEAWSHRLPPAARRIEVEEILSRAEGSMGETEAASAWQGRIFIGVSSMLSLWPPWSRQWRKRGLSASLVLDLQSGHARVEIAGAMADRLAAIEELVSACRSRGGVVFAEAPLAANSGSAAPEAAHAGLEARLKEAFDPRGLLPAVPRELEAGA